MATRSTTSGNPLPVSVISTGAVQIHPEHVFGTNKPLYWWILTSRRWLPPRPINVYVIEHPAGLVLFDTGQDRASVTDPRYFPGGPAGLIYRGLAKFRIDPADTLASQLEAAGHSVSDVRKAVLSHLHQDHIGGIRQLTHAELIVSEAEWQDLLKPLPEPRGLLRRHIDLPGLNWRRVRFQPTNDPALAPFTEAFDLMGDGSLILLATPGHTPGSLSLLVRRDGAGALLMVSDLTYAAELIERGQIPGVGDKQQLRATTAKVRELKRNQPRLQILAAHDPGAAEQLRQANTTP